MSDNGKKGLPPTWVELPLGEVRVDRSRGIVPRKQPKSKFKLYSVPSFDSRKPEIVQGQSIGSNKQTVETDTVLLCKINPRINRVWVVENHSPHPKIASTEWIPFCRVRELLPKYLCYYMRRDGFRDYLASQASGVGGSLMRIKASILADYPVPIAPLPEQHRIVDKVEELFSELDKGIESLKAARAKLETYRQAVLKHAFEGKLTAQWREENKDKLETPKQLLARITQKRKARYEQQLQEWKDAVKKWEVGGKSGKRPPKLKKLVDSPPPITEDVSALPKLPEIWCWVSLSAITGVIQIGPFGSLLHKSDYLVGGTPLVNPSHIRSQGIEPDLSLTVSTDKLDELRKYVLHEYDIVVGRRGEMGRCAVVTQTEAGWLCGTGSLFVRLLSSMNPHFYSLVLGSQRVKDFLAASSIGTTMQNLNEGILNGVPVPVCSRHEQDEVFRLIEGQYSTLDHIEAAIDSEIAKSSILRQSILRKAFLGQLVPQDPNDEPASVLLDRIKADRKSAERNNHSQKTKKRKTTA